MPDQFDALVGGVPTDPRVQQALIAQLRNQNLMGQMLASTGDRALAPMGELVARQAEGAGQNIGSLREREANARQALAFHQDEIAHQDAAQKQQMEIARMNDQRQREALNQQDQLRRDLMQQRINAAAELAREKAEAKANMPGKPLPQADTKRLDALGELLNGLDAAQQTYQKGYSGPGRAFENYVATNAGFLTSQKVKDQNAWWQHYGRTFKLEDLHQLFGARVSPTEQALFDKFHLSEGMTDDQILQTLGNLRRELGRAYGDIITNRKKAGFNADQLTDYMSRVPGDTSAALAPPKASQKYLDAVKGGVPAMAPGAQSPGTTSPVAAPPGIAPGASSLFPNAIKRPLGPPVDFNSMLSGGFGG